MSYFIRHYWVLLLFVGSQVLFWQFGEIDLWVSNLFYDQATASFAWKDLWPVKLSYWLFARAPEIYLIVIGWLLFASWRWAGKAEQGLRKRLVFLLLAWVIGPGLLVETLLKSESGRARPREVVQFTGDKPFTPAFTPAANCERNCSFTSGHAAWAFFIISFAWAFRQRRWLWIGGAVGAFAGLGRIVQGAHFLSDVVFSFWMVYLTCVVLSWLFWRRTHPVGREDPPHA